VNLLRDRSDINSALQIADINLTQLGKVANKVAAGGVFSDYQQRKSANTLRRQRANLALFQAFLNSFGQQVDDLYSAPKAWTSITWGLVAAFQRKLFQTGYALDTINLTLSTVKVYARLAARAGTLEVTEAALIRSIEGYAQREQNNLDQKREQAGIGTRIGLKREAPAILTAAQVKALKKQPDTPQGKRDAVILALLCDHGLRVSELATLRWENINLSTGEMVFLRPKVGSVGRHELSRDSLKALKAWAKIQDTSGALLKGSRKGGNLVGGMSVRAINNRVAELGKSKGLTIGPHDCRHTLATRLAKSLNLRQLMDVFGWSSPTMAMRYVAASEMIKVE
jgi:integrase